jgi:hypothetical protein
MFWEMKRIQKKTLRLIGIALVSIIVILVQAPLVHAAKPIAVTFEQVGFPDFNVLTDVAEGRNEQLVIEITDAGSLELTGDVSGVVTGGVVEYNYRFVLPYEEGEDNEVRFVKVTGEYAVSELVIGGSELEGELLLQFSYIQTGDVNAPEHFMSKGTWRIEGISGDVEDVTGFGVRSWVFGSPIVYSGRLFM